MALSSTSPQTFSLHRTGTRCSRFSSVVSQPRLVHAKLPSSPQTLLSSLRYNPLRVSIGSRNDELIVAKKKMSTVCYAGPYAAPLSLNNIQWISTVCSAILLLTKGTAVQKSFVVPLFVLQAPGSFISGIKGEYGIWTAFLALLVRLFFFMPGELELPLVALLLTILAPYQVMGLRGKQEGAIISIAIAGYMAFQHFSCIGSLKQSFDQGSIIATLAIIGITVMSCLLLF